MTSPDKMLTYIQACLDDLEDYLLSDILFWSLTKHPDLQRLTPGGLLFEMMRYRATIDSVASSLQFEKISNRLQFIKIKWQSAWNKKKNLEMISRVNLWSAYLADYQEDPKGQAESYAREVKWRVFIQILLGDSQLPVENPKDVEDLDTMVKSAWLPGGFIWEPTLAPVFPPPDYWFLYGKLK